MNANSSDFSSQYRPKAVYAGTLTAAGAGDATEVTSASIDRLGFDSVQLQVAIRTTCATAETMVLTVKISESDDDSTFATAVVLASAVTVVTGGASAQTVIYSLNISMAGRARYFKILLTPNLSAAGTDTAQYGAVAILGGATDFPVSA